MTSEDKCPKCGVGTLTQKHGLWRWYSCGTSGNLADELSEGPACLRNRLQSVERERDAARAEAERYRRALEKILDVEYDNVHDAVACRRIANDGLPATSEENNGGK